jgi:hypothetical protein
MREEGDTDEIRKIHRSYYQEEFPLPQFERCNIDAVITDGSGKILAVGGVYPTTELIMMVDKGMPRISRVRAIIELLNFASYTQGISGGDMHAFIQDPEFARLLRKHFGFVDCKGEALVKNG